MTPPESPRPLTLVVEDDDGVASLLEMTFSAIGHDVVVARDGREAIADAKRLLPDLVLLDSGIPGMAGADVCRVLGTFFSIECARRMARSLLRATRVLGVSQ